jgi:hypothetical protein
VQCNNIYTLLHTLTTCIATSALWQWTRHRIAAVICTDPRYVPPQWLVLPDITFWPKKKRQAKMWLIGHYIHYVVRNGSSGTLHDYMEFLPRAFKKAEEIWKKDHIPGAYLGNCTLRYPFLLTP